MEHGTQDLVLFEKNKAGIKRSVICEVLFVSLRGKHGVTGKQKADTPDLPGGVSFIESSRPRQADECSLFSRW